MFESQRDCVGCLVLCCNGPNLSGEDVLHYENIFIAILGFSSAVVNQICGESVVNASGHDFPELARAWRQDLSVALGANVGVYDVSGYSQATALCRTIQALSAGIAQFSCKCFKCFHLIKERPGLRPP